MRARRRRPAAVAAASACSTRTRHAGSCRRPTTSPCRRPRRCSTLVSIGVPTVAPSVVMSEWSNASGSPSWRWIVQTTSGVAGRASRAARAKAGATAMLCSTSTASGAASTSRAPAAAPLSRPSTSSAATTSTAGSAAVTAAARPSRSARRSMRELGSQNVQYGESSAIRGRPPRTASAPVPGGLVEMPDLRRPHQLAVAAGEVDDGVLEPLGPPHVGLAVAQAGDRGGEIGVALDVGDDLRAAPEQGVVLEAGLLDVGDELRPDLVVPLLVLVLPALVDLEGEAGALH